MECIENHAENFVTSVLRFNQIMKNSIKTQCTCLIEWNKIIRWQNVQGVTREISLGIIFLLSCSTFCLTFRELQFCWFTDFEQKIIKAVIDFNQGGEQLQCFRCCFVLCKLYLVNWRISHQQNRVPYCDLQRISRISSFIQLECMFSLFINLSPLCTFSVCQWTMSTWHYQHHDEPALSVWMCACVLLKCDGIKRKQTAGNKSDRKRFPQ